MMMKYTPWSLKSKQCTLEQAMLQAKKGLNVIPSL